MGRKPIVFVWVVLFFVAAGLQGTVLDVKQKYQEQTQWCWAGTSQAILQYYGFVYTQTQIAQYGTEGANEWNWLWGESSSPTRRGINMIMSHFASLSTNQYSRALSLNESSVEIEAIKPFFIRWGWDGGGGHFVVGHGVESQTMYLMDPWYGPTINTYDWVVVGSSHTWTHTLGMATAPSVKTDILASWSGQGVYWRNSATGVWTKIASPATRMTAGDLDNDGIDDPVAIWPGQNGIFVRNSSTGSWVKLSSAGDDIACGDINGDGRSDLLATWSGQGLFWRNSATGIWTKIASPATRISAGDIDGDGKADAVAVWPGQNGIFVRYSATSTWSKVSSAADDIACGDINGDDRADILATWSGQGLYYRNSLSGVWAKLASPATAVSAGDIDGDGTGDAVAVWPAQSGIFVRYSSTSSWTKIASAATDVAAGKLRGASGMTSQMLGCMNGQQFGRYDENAEFGRYLDISFNDPLNMPEAVLDLSLDDPLNAPEKVIEESSEDPCADPDDEARRLPGPGEQGGESEKDPGTAKAQIEEKG